MSPVEDIERAVRQLEPEDLATFRHWFGEFDAEVWDRQIEEDITAGRLDALADQALRDRHEGHCTEL